MNIDPKLKLINYSRKPYPDSAINAAYRDTFDFEYDDVRYSSGEFISPKEERVYSSIYYDPERYLDLDERKLAMNFNPSNKNEKYNLTEKGKKHFKAVEAIIDFLTQFDATQRKIKNYGLSSDTENMFSGLLSQI
jgi:hypothetical protein